MEVGAASALALYNYQTALKSYGQSPASPASTQNAAQNAAVVQALANTYSSLTGNVNGMQPATDTFSALAGSSALAPLISGMYSASAADGNTSLPLGGLAASLATFGGLDTSSALILFSGTSTNHSNSLPSSAIDLNAKLALAAYSNQQDGVATGTIGAAASAAAAKAGTSPSGVQTALQGAQSGSLSSILNLLG